MTNGDFASWIGRETEAIDTLDETRANALQAALGQPLLEIGAALPPLRHWLYFWDVQPPGNLGIDGHPARGGFLPPVPLPRRMWAGGRVQFVRPLPVGASARRVSTIVAIDMKQGRSGSLVFVTLRHEVTADTGLVIEEQDLVYRDNTSAKHAATIDPPTPGATWQDRITPDPVLLFRYSALTMNGHRIHYDRRYAMEEEGYRDLVVHGPLQATLLVDLAARRAPAPITGFAFRGLTPAFDGESLDVLGEPLSDRASLWIEQGGTKTMTATADWNAA